MTSQRWVIIFTSIALQSRVTSFVALRKYTLVPFGCISLRFDVLVDRTSPV
ncbi:hypothetical protein ALC56_10884 [Trachymyrmex septentrionalis]|uniref:Uncharacterized protein n=1 Tax=Trachymyrmex septentrionalis TaxID=34720 RepID=A0A195F3F6_9HYME|nr:hypothetical protein ALC56_10884 [Trachymyrmex septentrionalis]